MIDSIFKVVLHMLYHRLLEPIVGRHVSKAFGREAEATLEEGAYAMRYSTGGKVFFILLTLGLGLLLQWCVRHSLKEDGIDDGEIFLIVLLGTLFLMAVHTLYCFVVEHFKVTSEGFHYRGTIHQGYLRWKDVTHVAHDDFMKYFVLTPPARAHKPKVSFYLSGLGRFAQTVLAHVPENAIEPNTFKLLSKTAKGELPNVV